MHPDAKKRVVDAVDAMVADGVVPTSVSLHPDTAREWGLNATRLELGADYWAPSASKLAAELTHPDYDRNPARDADGRPHPPDRAAELASAQALDHLRRDVALDVALDPSVEPGKLLVHGTTPHKREA